MNIKDKKRELALYRIQQADESLDEARFLFEGSKSPRSIINRAYYSMFYAILSLLVFEPFSSSKHSGVISYFNRHFIKRGVFSLELGRAVNKAFDLRQRGDYREQVNVTADQAEPFLDWARKLIDSVKKYLKSRGHI